MDTGKPFAAWFIATVLIANGAIGLTELSQLVVGKAPGLFALLALADKSTKLAALGPAGSAFCCFLIGGLALVFSRKLAVFFYGAGALCYIVFFGILIFPLLWAFASEAYAGDLIGPAAVLIPLIFLAGLGAGLLLVRGIYHYLQNLSWSGILR